MNGSRSASINDSNNNISMPITDSEECDECDINGHHPNDKLVMRKKFTDAFRMTDSCLPSTTSPSPSRMSPSSCGTPTTMFPSTCTSIRDAVSHLTRLDDFNVIKLSQGFFSQVFKVFIFIFLFD